MKNFFILFALCFAVVFQSCDTGSRPENNASVEQVEPGQRESSNLNDAGLDGEGHTTQMTAYVCPMRCEGSGSNEPGKCPVCNMDLVRNPEMREGTKATQGEVLNHKPGQENQPSMDDQLEPQPR